MDIYKIAPEDSLENREYTEEVYVSSMVSEVQDKLIENFFPLIYANLEKVERLVLEDKQIDPGVFGPYRLTAAWVFIRQNMSPIEEDLCRICRDEWNSLDLVEDRHVTSHTIAALVTAYLDPMFKSLDHNDKSIILWACLFHDIAKRGPPEIPGKDPFHPFTSAAKALRIFNRLGWIPVPSEIEPTIELLNSSYIICNDTQFMDNIKLPLIIAKLLYITGIIPKPDFPYTCYADLTNNMPKSRLFVYEILAIILFHQSINLSVDYPNFTPLPYAEIRNYFSQRLLHLLSLLHKGDTGSYNLSDPVKTWKFPKKIEIEVHKYYNLLE